MQFIIFKINFSFGDVAQTTVDCGLLAFPSEVKGGRSSIGRCPDVRRLRQALWEPNLQG